MTKTKIIVLVILLLTLIPSYVNLSCIEGYCMAGKESCFCGFLPLEFFVCFVWVYVFSCLIVEAAKATGIRIKKR